jgi:hypothetical protein
VRLPSRRPRIRFGDGNESAIATPGFRYGPGGQGGGDPLSISGTWPDDLVVGQAVTPFTPTVSGGTAPYSFAVIGTAPSGVSISQTTGARSGTPALEGPYSFTIRVTDAASATADLAVSGSVTLAGAPFLVSVETHGFLAEATNTPTDIVIDQFVPVLRTGYLGTTSLTTWTEQVLVHQRAPTPGSFPRAYSGNRVVLNSVILSGDVISGTVNNSTRTAPALEGFFTCPLNQVLGNSVTLTSVWECAMTRNGVPVTLVRYTISSLDGPQEVTADVTAPVARSHSLTGLSSHSWEATLDTSVIPDGHRVKYRMQGYGPYGQVFDSDDWTSQADILIGRGSRRGLKHNGIATNPVKVVLRDTASGSPTASTDYATAYSGHYARTTAGINSARTAARSLNLSTYGIDGLDGVEFYIGGTAIDTTFHPTSLTVLYTGIIIRSDPTDFPGGADFFTNFQPNWTGHLEGAPHNIYGLTFRDFAKTRRRSPSGNTTVDFISGSGITDLWIEGGEHDCLTPGSANAFLVDGGGVATFLNVTITNNTGGAGNYTGVITGGNVKYLRVIGSRFAEVSSGIQEVASPLKIGSVFERTRFRLIDISNSWAVNSHIADGCRLFNHNPTANGIMLSAPTLAQKDNTRGWYWRNCLFENVSNSNNDRASLLSDGNIESCFCVVFRNCTGVGFKLAGRWNAYYNQSTPSPVSMFQYTFFDACIMPRSASKGDMDGTPDGARYVGWAEQGTMVLGRGNWVQWVPAPNDRRDSWGPGSVTTTDTEVWNDPGFVDYRGSDGVTLGSGYGDYNLTASAPARGGVSYIPACRFDAEGNALPIGTVHTTPGYLANKPAP